jgi:hypothetical protein
MTRLGRRGVLAGAAAPAASPAALGQAAYPDRAIELIQAPTLASAKNGVLGAHHQAVG